MARILVVDDDPFVQGAIKALLQRKGFEVVLAGSGEAGLRALNDAAFDIAIVDIFMADLDGLETISAMRELAPWMAVIAMSGFSDREAVVRSWYFLRMAEDVGASATLCKPFRTEELMAAIGTCLGPPFKEPTAASKIIA